VKPTPLSAVLADDLLLDSIGARQSTDDELGSLLLAVAHHVDAPVSRRAPTRRFRRHRGLTVLAALGVAVSGATVAAAVELGPVSPDQASRLPHTRAFLPPSLQALVMPFLTGSPFQGRLVLPYGLGGPLTTGVATTELPAVALSAGGGLAAQSAAAATAPAGQLSAAQEAQVDRQDQSDTTTGTTKTTGASVASPGSEISQATTGNGQGTDQREDETTAEAPVLATQPEKPVKPAPTPPSPPVQANPGNGTTNGQATGIVNGNGQAHGRGTTNGSGSGVSGGTGATGGTSTSTDGGVTGASGSTGSTTEDRQPGSSATATGNTSGSGNGKAPTTSTGGTGSGRSGGGSAKKAAGTAPTGVAAVAATADATTAPAGVDGP
jgi:hypothetical protein